MSEVPEKSSSPIRSMTGYATTRRETPAGELTISLRTVNHRGLDAHFYHSSEFAQFENGMREILKRHIARGHVEIRTSLQRNGSGEIGIDRGILTSYVEAFRQVAQELEVSTQPDVNVLMQLPGVVTRVERPDGITLDGNFGGELVEAFAACASELNICREREGAALAMHIVEEISAMEEKTRQMAAIRKGATQKFQERLRERLRELLGGSSMTESRLAEEAALLADRSDVQEEITRLQVHTAELRRIVEAGGEVGKRIDFLLQEMNRETNTVLSKTSGVGDLGLTITKLGLAVKAHIEKTREQALNLE
ncbi:MAG TPA: YicC/YloC family endoribonuclease [Bryobacteraceae bacterium]|jgi:uncharacterized protein (TIGR00255 family)|nr:YicC/YloC family endoribonuclease [Bryobacteraceae bacterium]